VGADLITYIMKGPSKIEKADRTAALRAVNKFLAAGADLVAAYDTVEKVTEKSKGWEEITDDDVIRCEKVMEDLLSTRDSVLADFSEDVGDDTSIIIDNMRSLAEGFSPEEFVDEFIAWWDTGSGRDTNTRLDPDNIKQKIVVCGDMSWDGSPDGYGYTITRKAYWFGVPQALGIR
jgi:hypothetical protein